MVVENNHRNELMNDLYRFTACFSQALTFVLVSKHADQETGSKLYSDFSYRALKLLFKMLCMLINMKNYCTVLNCDSVKPLKRKGRYFQAQEYRFSLFPTLRNAVHTVGRDTAAAIIGSSRRC